MSRTLVPDYLLTKTSSSFMSKIFFGSFFYFFLSFYYGWLISTQAFSRCFYNMSKYLGRSSCWFYLSRIGYIWALLIFLSGWSDGWASAQLILTNLMRDSILLFISRVNKVFFRISHRDLIYEKGRSYTCFPLARWYSNSSTYLISIYAREYILNLAHWAINSHTSLFLKNR